MGPPFRLGAADDLDDMKNERLGCLRCAWRWRQNKATARELAGTWFGFRDQEVSVDQRSSGADNAIAYRVVHVGPFDHRVVRRVIVPRG